MNDHSVTASKNQFTVIEYKLTAKKPTYSRINRNTQRGNKK